VRKSRIIEEVDNEDTEMQGPMSDEDDEEEEFMSKKGRSRAPARKAVATDSNLESSEDEDPIHNDLAI
jgi:hypothetical protein